MSDPSKISAPPETLDQARSTEPESVEPELVEQESVDEAVLRLRSAGTPYARISRDLGLERAAEAQQAFRRALSRLPETDAKRVREEEVLRLDRLADRVRGDERNSDEDRARRLGAIERMRIQISTGS